MDIEKVRSYKHWLVAVKEPWSPKAEIVHAAGYELPPTQKDAEMMRVELFHDPVYGVAGQDSMIIRDAKPEEVEMIKEMAENIAKVG